MSISWQTGEPPCGRELLIEYRYRMTTKILHTVAAKSQPNGAYWCENRNSIESIQIEVIRWSTLDDDRSAKAMGALEKYIDASADPLDSASVVLNKLLGYYHATVVKLDGHLGDEMEAFPSLIEAIEKLTEHGNGLQGD